KKDRYGRYLGELFLGDRSLNLELVEQGHALIYRNYEFQTIKQKVDYLVSEMAAKRKRLGMWSTFGFNDPYVHRRRKRFKSRKQ
ncbi:MAG: thermonuclease family protein, partial [Bacteriovoracaceae bacterium]|nr:thermonuclease family protein [Bacteriovoracaceae bacterium]